MATEIRNLTDNQRAALINVFGYESYPNGNHGFPREAVAWLESQGLLARYRSGNAATTATAVAKAYWPKTSINWLRANKREQRGRPFPLRWR